MDHAPFLDLTEEGSEEKVVLEDSELAMETAEVTEPVVDVFVLLWCFVSVPRCFLAVSRRATLLACMGGPSTRARAWHHSELRCMLVASCWTTFIHPLLEEDARTGGNAPFAPHAEECWDAIPPAHDED